jgi:hypothetical protein
MLNRRRIAGMPKVALISNLPEDHVAIASSYAPSGFEVAPMSSRASEDV